MAELDEQFEQAAADAQSLSERPDNDTMLSLYALYKQATSGDVSGKRPGFTNLVGRAKYDAWSEKSGLSQEDAKTKYVELVESLK